MRIQGVCSNLLKFFTGRIIVLILLSLLAGACSAGEQTALLPAATATLSGQAILSAANTAASAQIAPQATSTPIPAPPGCRTYRAVLPTPTAASSPELPGDWTLGARQPRVTIVVYSDFQCADCARLAPILTQLADEFPDTVQVIFRHYPVTDPLKGGIHPKSALAIRAAEAAGRQGKFWAMYTLLYSRRVDWIQLDAAAFETWVTEQAAELNLDVAGFQTDLKSPALIELADKAWQNGVSLGFPEPPVVFMDGNYTVAPSFWNLSAVIRLTLLSERQYPTCPAFSIDTLKRYTATLKTPKGDIVLDLFAEQAPLAVNNFVFLVRQGWYKDLTFHRVLPGFIAQTGDPSGTGFGGPGYAFDNESTPGQTFDRAGLLAMANTGKNTNGSQFFITYAPAHELDGKYTIFGQVTSGMDVLLALTPRNPDLNADLPPGDPILEISLEER